VPGALAAEDGQRGGDPVQDAFEVDVDHRLPVRDAQVLERGDRADAGVADKDVEPAEALARQRDEPGEVLPPADVRTRGDDVPARRLDAGRDGVEAHPPAEALRLWFDRLASYGRIKLGVAQAVEAATRAGLSGEYYDQVIAAITLLLDAGKREGVLRPDVDAEEVLLLVGFLWRIDDAGWETRSHHLLTLVMDGLRSRPGDEP